MGRSSTRSSSSNASLSGQMVRAYDRFLRDHHLSSCDDQEDGVISSSISSESSNINNKKRGDDGTVSMDESKMTNKDVEAALDGVDPTSFDELEGSRKVGSIYKDLNCLCNPTRSKPSEVCGRLGGWFAVNMDQIMSSAIVSMSMIPEAISYAIIAGLPPSFALQSCWISCMLTAIIGGRPGMITSASGLAALLLSRLINTDTIGASSIMFVPLVVGFAGVLQSVSAFFGFGRLANNFPVAMIIGIVNGLAILTLALQCRYAKEFPLTEVDMQVGTAAAGTNKAVEIEWTIALFSYFGVGLEWIQPWLNFGVYIGEVVVAFAITMYLPKLWASFPAPIVAMLAVLVIELGIARQFGVATPLLMDYGGVQVTYPWTTVLNAEYSLPSFADWETWKIVVGYGSALFATQFVETSVALNIVNQLDESDGPGFLVLFGQGMSNVLIGFMGGMGANGSLSMSMLADKTFGTTCLSTFLTGLMLLVFTGWAYPVIDYMPLSAMSGISIAIACSYIQWRSLLAVFTIFLPNSKRALLPQQFLFGRVEVCIIFFITAALLIADVSALAFFVFAVFVGLIKLLRYYRNEVDEDETTDETEEGTVLKSVNNTILRLVDQGILPETFLDSNKSKSDKVEKDKGGSAKVEDQEPTPGIDESWSFCSDEEEANDSVENPYLTSQVAVSNKVDELVKHGLELEPVANEGAEGNAEKSYTW